MTGDGLNRAVNSDQPPAVDGRFRLRVSTDKLAVYMDNLQPPSGGGSLVTSKQVHDKLKKLEITYGVDQKKIDEILAALNEGRLPSTDSTVNNDPGVTCQESGSDPNDRFCIARGEPPVHGEHAALHWQVDLERVQNQDYVALPNQLIATYTPPGEAKTGKSVFGKELRAQPGRDGTIKPGAGIESVPTEDGAEFRAKWYGIVRVDDISISVVCPLKITDDGLSATMDLAPPSTEGYLLEVPHVVDTLKQHGINFGINEEQLLGSLEKLKTAGQTVKGVKVAQGVPAIHGVDASLKWSIEKDKIAGNDIIVRPGTHILTLNTATTGHDGQDIYGNVLTATPGKVIVIQTDRHIVVEEESGQYCSSVVGMLGCEILDEDNFKLTINPELEVSDNAMEASLTLRWVAGDGSSLTPSDFIKSLDTLGIKYGRDESAIVMAFKTKDITGDQANRKIVVARGKAPRDGVDAHITYTQKEHIAGVEVGKGRIDFREHNFLWSFKNGDVIGHIVKAKPEEDGMNVWGEPIKAAPPSDIQLVLSGAHIDDHNRIMADTDGTLIIDGQRLSLSELYVINGDVGAKTGNIHSVNDVNVKGHIQPGFEIESEKSIIIGMNIEGAKVTAGGNISIKGGIRGQRSEVYTPGEISVGFVENADVFVNGDITITGSVINSKVSSNSAIAVGSKTSKRGAVIGGRVTAHDRVEAFELGSSAYRKTVVSVGFTQEAKQQQRDLKQAIEAKEAELTSLEQLEARCRHHPQDNTGEILRKVDITRKAVVEALNDLRTQLDEVIKTVEQYNNVRVIVHKRVFPGVIIEINDHIHEVTHELGGGTFILENDEVIFRPG